MSDLDNSPAQTRPVRAALTYWPMSLAVSMVLLFLGVYAGHSRAPVYTSEVRLAVGGQGLSSYAIPGFALAAQELAANYARYVSLPQDTQILKTALGAHAAEVVALSASPVPTSNVVSIVAQSKDREIANKAATAAGTALINAVNGQTNDQIAAGLLKQYNTLSASVAQANLTLQDATQIVAKLTATPSATASQLAAAQQAEVAASTAYASLQLQQSVLGTRYQTTATTDTPSSDLSVVQPAAIILSNATKNEELFGLIGLASGFALALAFATLRARRASRRQRVREVDRQPVPEVRVPSTLYVPKVGRPKVGTRPATADKVGGRSGETVRR